MTIQQNISNRILIATATYNELDSIQHFLKQTVDAYPEADILVVDDNSPDGTGEMLNTLTKTLPNLSYISRPRKLGIGSAHLLIMQYALDHHYSALITLDADLSHDPYDIPTIVQLLKYNDFVIGSRYVSGGSCDYGFFRQLLSRSANFLNKVLLGIKLKESTTSFRGFSRKLLHDLPLQKFSAVDYGFFIETVFRINQLSASTAEFPIHFHDRRFGQTKISKKAILKALNTLIHLFISRLSIQPRKSEISRPTPERTTPCQICQSPYHLEIFPAIIAKDSLTAKAVSCSTSHHRSHGRIAKCLQCGSVATNPMPSSSALLQSYANVIDETYFENIAARDATFKYNFNYARKALPSSGRIIDIGCYCGGFLKVAHDLSYDVIGVEPSVWAANKARVYSGCNVFTGTLQDLPIHENLFDIATAFDVMEHLISPYDELIAINRRLKIGGFFVFSTLDYENWFSQFLGENWPWMMDMHLHYFDIPSIIDLLRDSGFRVVEIRPYSHIIPLQYFLSKMDSITGLNIHEKISKLLPNSLRKKHIKFCFGDIKMYTCVKVSDA